MKSLGQNIISKEKEIINIIAHLNVSPISKVRLTKLYYKTYLRANT